MDRLTELVYAHIKDEDVLNRMIDSLDPRYARRALKARGKKKLVKTITKLPEPKVRTLFDVDGIERTLAEWAIVSSIPKTTLFHRVVKVGMSMADALALGRGRRGRRLAGANAKTGQTKAPVTTPTNQPEAFDTCDQERPKKSLIVEAPSDDCRTGAADRMEKVNVTDADSAHPTSPSREKLAEILVRRDGIEPPTRGFSIPCSTD